jgi:hypothetical protein
MDGNKEPWENEITIDTLPTYELQFLAERFGLDVAKKIIEEAAGLIIQVPTNPFKKAKLNYILKNYDGTSKSISKLATDCNITTRHIKTLLRENGKYKN